MERTHYDTLEVSPKASLEAIKGAYRFLCQKWHPDKNPQSQAQAEQLTRELNEAYAVLSDPERRAAYDALLAASAWRQARPGAGSGGQPRSGGYSADPSREQYAARAARAYRRVQESERVVRRARQRKLASVSTQLTLALAAMIVAALFAINPGLPRQHPAAGQPAARPARAAMHDVYAEYWAEMTALRQLHPELDPASQHYDRDRALGFNARIGQYMDRGLSPTQALQAAAKDTYSP